MELNETPRCNSNNGFSPFISIVQQPFNRAKLSSLPAVYVRSISPWKRERKASAEKGHDIISVSRVWFLKESRNDALEGTTPLSIRAD